MTYKKTKYGIIPEHWEEKRISEIAIKVTDYVANGSFKSLADNVTYKETESYAVLIRLTDFNNSFKDGFVYVDEASYNFLKKSRLSPGDIIISNVGANVGTVFKCPDLTKPMTLGPNAITVEFNGDNGFYYYFLKSRAGQSLLKSIVTGSAQPKFNKTNFKELVFPVPPLVIQRKIASILSAIDDKIELNNHMNDNLEEQAKALFVSTFSEFKYGGLKIGDYIIPNRGKNLLSKNFIPGPYPVVAGGLEAAGYHNECNTEAPVLTISSSGANAGYVRLWLDDVWSSDSSYIDSKLTTNVYFWYILLKLRQKEIFDAQTGSAQAHIYPKHIAALPVGLLDECMIFDYNNTVKPLFEKIRGNILENQHLAELRDTLLPKLMSGEIDVDSIKI